MYRGLILVLLLAAVAVGQGDEARQEISFDALRIAQNLGADSQFSGRLPLAEAYLPSNERREGRQLMDPDFLLDAVRALGNSEAFENDRAQAKRRDGRIVVAGDQEILDDARRVISFFESAFAQPVTVEVWGLSGSGGGVLSEEETRARLQSDTARLLGRRDLIPGQRARVASHLRDRFVSAFETEVAQEAVTTEPLVSTLVTGLTLDMRVDWLGRASVFVDYALLKSKLTSMAEAEPAAHDAGRLQLPRVDSVQFGGTAIVPLGGAVQVSVARRSFLLRFRGEAPAFELDDRARILPIGALIAPRRRFPLVTLSHRRVRDAFEQDGPEEEEGISPEALCDHGMMSAGEEFLDSEEARVNCVGSRLVIYGPKQFSSQVAKAIEEAGKPSLVQRRVEMRMVGIPPRSIDVVQAARAAKGVSAQGVITAVDGRAFRILAGEESTDIRDFSVSVAQKAVGHSPVVGMSFEGLVFDGVLEQRANGRIAMRGAFAISESRVGKSPAPHITVNTGKHKGAVELPATHDRVLEIATYLKADESWQVIAVVEGADQPLALMVRLKDL